MSNAESATTAPTRFIKENGRELAYRSSAQTFPLSCACVSVARWNLGPQRFWTAEGSPFGRRRQRRYSAECKVEVAVAWQRLGVLIAAIALMHQVNAKLLRLLRLKADRPSRSLRAP